MSSMQLVFVYCGSQLRTVTVDGDPWWVAKDVCDILDISNSRDAVSRLDDDEKGVVSTDTPGGVQELQAVNEAGLYTLILGSRKSDAKVFKRWVTHEVLPSIRKTGAYGVPTSPTQALLQAVQIMAEQEKQIRALTEAHAQSMEQLTVLGHRVDNLDAANIDGDLRQRLEKMVKRYAWSRGIIHSAAWHHFDQAYNTAFRTNLTTLRQNYCRKTGVKEVSRPEYLEKTGKLEDAIRIADKLINKSA